MTRSGAQLFARYAYPPNELGYCGPNDAAPLLEHGFSGDADQEIAARARNRAASPASVSEPLGVSR